PGKGSSTPVVWGNRVFVMSAENTGRQAKPDEVPKKDPTLETRTNPPTVFYKFWVACYDLESGNELWRKLAAERVPHEGARPSPTTRPSPTAPGRRRPTASGSIARSAPSAPTATTSPATHSGTRTSAPSTAGSPGAKRSPPFSTRIGSC